MNLSITACIVPLERGGFSLPSESRKPGDVLHPRFASAPDGEPSLIPHARRLRRTTFQPTSGREADFHRATHLPNGNQHKLT
jgi:hypothetical protein